MIGAYHKCVAETVARFDGFVAKYMGVPRGLKRPYGVEDGRRAASGCQIGP